MFHTIFIEIENDHQFEPSIASRLDEHFFTDNKSHQTLFVAA